MYSNLYKSLSVEYTTLEGIFSFFMISSAVTPFAPACLNPSIICQAISLDKMSASIGDFTGKCVRYVLIFFGLADLN
jgi:hypothetical protein